MITNIIYFTVFLILAFVLSIAVKAITRGVEAKQNIKEEKNLELKKENEEKDLEVINQIKELKNTKIIYADFTFFSINFGTSSSLSIVSSFLPFG